MSKNIKNNSKTTDKEDNNMIDEINENEPLILAEADILVAEDNEDLLDDEFLYDRVNRFINSHSKYQDETYSRITTDIRYGCELINKFNEKIIELQETGVTERNEGTITSYRLLQGRLIDAVKHLIDLNKENWDDWARCNLKNITTKKLDDYMLMESFEDSEYFAWLGEERLILLASATEESGCEYISEFLGFLLFCGDLWI